LPDFAQVGHSEIEKNPAMRGFFCLENTVGVRMMKNKAITDTLLTDAQGETMSKGKDAKKAVKKKSEKTLKEKRQEKKDKKASKTSF
jgi:hypothetical protein